MREERLHGGNMTEVVRIGGAVHRSAGLWTPTIQRLLTHLRASGLDGVPEPRGFDEKGREVLEFIDGSVPQYPMPSWVWSDEVLADAAALLRRIHDASSGFDRSDAIWQLREHQPDEVICHNDFAPYNLVFDAGRLVGVIDFDTASPGPRVWDLAYLAYRLVPLAPPDDIRDPSLSSEEIARRLDLVLEAYRGNDPAAVGDLSATLVRSVAVERLLELAVFTDERAAAGGPPELTRHAEMYRRHAAQLAAEPQGDEST
jgi:aminoglycoside phosphotransferase (APT) family kinase protein